MPVYTGQLVESSTVTTKRGMLIGDEIGHAAETICYLGPPRAILRIQCAKCHHV